MHSTLPLGCIRRRSDPPGNHTYPVRTNSKSTSRNLGTRPFETLLLDRPLSEPLPAPPGQRFHLTVQDPTWIGIAAEAHAAKGRGRGPHGVLLADGHSVRGRTARREVDRARTIAVLPRMAVAFEAGRIGAAQIDAVALAGRGLSADEMTSLDSDDLVDAATTLPADAFARHVRELVEQLKGDDGLGATNDRRAQSSWKHWFNERTGMGHLHGEFDPERYESIVGSIEAELGRLANNGGVSKDARLAADAAYNLLTGSELRRSGRPHINVVVDWETFTRGCHDASVRETANGHPLPPESIARLACDAVLQRVVLDPKGVPINVGRGYRTATDAQWHAVRSIYRSCAWHGCDRPLARCQLHHVREWERGGSTDLCNLIPLCLRHHHAVHEGGWAIKIDDDDRRVTIHTPDGTLHAVTWPDRVGPPTVRGSPTAA